MNEEHDVTEVENAVQQLRQGYQKPFPGPPGKSSYTTNIVAVIDDVPVSDGTSGNLKKTNPPE